MGLLDRFKRNRDPAAAPAPPPQPAPNPVAAPASGSGTTQIDREHCLLHAPFEWKAVPSDQPLEFDFRNQTIPEQLMITVLIARESFSGPKLREVAEQLTEMRIKVLSRLTEGRSVASPVQYQSGSGQVE